MILLFGESGPQIRGDLIQSAILRSDLSPVPVTLEAFILAGDASMDSLLAVDKIITTGAGDALRIVKSEKTPGREVQGGRLREGYRITAMLDACHQIAFVRRVAIIKEVTSLLAVYRAAGCVLRAVDADVPIPRFSCFVGEAPAFGLARALQEAGGCVRWRAGRLQFLRLLDLQRQPLAATIPANAAEDVESGFLERHEVPWFYSLAQDGSVVFGNRDKPRAARFAPHADAMTLQNMTRALILRKTARIGYSAKLAAGDAVLRAGDANPMTVITGMHVTEAGEGGGAPETYTKLWLGTVES